MTEQTITTAAAISAAQQNVKDAFRAVEGTTLAEQDQHAFRIFSRNTQKAVRALTLRDGMTSESRLRYLHKATDAIRTASYTPVVGTTVAAELLDNALAALLPVEEKVAARVEEKKAEYAAQAAAYAAEFSAWDSFEDDEEE